MTRFPSPFSPGSSIACSARMVPASRPSRPASTACSARTPEPSASTARSGTTARRATRSPTGSAWCTSISPWSAPSPASRTSWSAPETRDRRAAERRIETLAAELGLALDLHRPVSQLSVGEQQWIEILAALFGEARLLILDEPTAVLTPQESAQLFAMIRLLCARGVSVILISHKLDEVLRCDRITVIRRGRVVATVDARRRRKEELAAHDGRPCRSALDAKRGRRRRRRGSPMLEVRGLTVKGRRGARPRRRIVHRASRRDPRHRRRRRQRPGRAVRGARRRPAGRAGRRDHSRRPARSSGLTPTAIAAEGVGYVPSDRYRDGLVAEFTVAENLLLGRQNTTGLPARSRSSASTRSAAAAEASVAAFDIRTETRRRAGAHPFRRQRPEADPRPRTAARDQVPALQPADPRPRCRRHRICPPANPRRGGRRVAPCCWRARSSRIWSSLADRIMVLFRGTVMGIVDAADHRPSGARPDDGRPEGGEPARHERSRPRPIRGFRIVRARSRPLVLAADLCSRRASARSW